MVLNPNVDNRCILVDALQNLLDSIFHSHFFAIFVLTFPLFIFHRLSRILCRLDRRIRSVAGVPGSVELFALLF